MKTKFLRNILVILFLVVHYNSFSQTADHWESIIIEGDSCKYIVPDSEISNWHLKDFNDSAWPKGKSGIGYGDNDDNTVLPNGTMSVYLRFEFTVQSISDIADLLLDIDFDDGFVAYLNGVEVARENVEDPISWNMELTNLHEATMYSGINPERYEIDEFIASALEVGKNVLAIEVHNEQASSSDMSSIVFLHAEMTRSDMLYSPVPDWFGLATVSFTEFNLPLMIINTNGQTIPDEPRIVADMGLIYNGEGNLNVPNDAWNEYSGKISIEQRGESSQGFAKKSYSIELQNADGSNNNVSILGLPEENDFVLYGPYSDKTMIKNVLTYELFRKTGRWAPGTRYIEVILNDEYEGVYVFTEKLKRDENRVDIDKLTSEDVSPVDISGGYILRRDKKDGLAAEEWWTSPVEQPYHERMWYDYYDPEYYDLTTNQSLYIRNWMKNFDQIMSGSDFTDLDNGYRKQIKTKSFIDMMIVNEISKGIDNYLFSTYFYKENDADGGQLVAGPPWDYNLGYGNLDYGDDWNAKETYGWCYPQGGRVYWFERLMEDEDYKNMVYCRWSEHRDNIYSDESVVAVIDSCVSYIGDAVDRNFAKFPTLGYYVWPAIEPYPETYEEEVNNLKVWLIERLAWMDDQWLNKGNCSAEPPTDISLSNNSILENQPDGTEIGVLATIDPDSDNHYYSLSKGSGDDDNGKFTIVDNILLSNMVFDYYTQSSFAIRISSTDKDFEKLEKSFEVLVSNPTWVENITDANSFILYPNPSSGSIRINAGSYSENSLRVQIIDLSGKVLFDYEGQLGEINMSLSGDSEGLGKGVYFVSINTDRKAYTKKFIKL